MRVGTSFIALLVGGMALAGCGSSAPTATPTVTVTSAPLVVTFNPATSGKTLAARVASRVKPKTKTVKITAVECRNFPDLKVGTHADCQMRVNGVKRGFSAIFTVRPGHYVLRTQKLTW